MTILHLSMRWKSLSGHSRISYSHCNFSFVTKVLKKQLILNLQYLTHPNSDSIHFFLKLGDFSRGTHIYNSFFKILHKNFKKKMIGESSSTTCRQKKFYNITNFKSGYLPHLDFNSANLFFEFKYFFGRNLDLLFCFVNFAPKISDLICKLLPKKIPPKKKKKENFFPLGPKKCSVEDVAHA